MQNAEFAKLAIYDQSEDRKEQKLIKALNQLSDVFGIEFGSITIHFHKGDWSPKIEIKKNLIKEVLKK